MTARIVFDLDGTLIDSAPDLQGIANALMAERGLDPISMAQTRDFIGNGVAVFVAKLCALRGLSESEEAPLVAAFKARYVSAVGLTKPYPGVLAALDALKAQGHRLGICTNKPETPTHAVLDHLGLDGYFDCVFGGDTLPVHKPDPAPLEAAFAALGDGPRIYVGDSDVDAETAVAASVPFLLFTEGYRKGPVASMPHSLAFSDWADAPDLVAALLASAEA